MMALGLWGLIMRRVNLSVSVLAAMSLGLVVDDTIHFLNKYLYAKRQLHMNPPEAIRYTFHTVGGALFKTSAILVSGFLVLSLSGFKVNSYMGLLTAIAIAFALLADFLFLPPLLLKLDKNNKN
jgi:predicted RND superfamily exporter protein